MRLAIFVILLIYPFAAIADIRIEGQRPFTQTAHMTLPDLLTQGLSETVSHPPADRLLFPADGRISSLFGWRKDPIVGGARFHAGIDLANLRSSQVTAADSGRVAFAGWAKGCGLMVAIRHKETLETRYCHLERVFVKKGHRVHRGDTIGAMGDTGRTTGPHLHFEVIENGIAVDPAIRLVSL